MAADADKLCQLVDALQAGLESRDQLIEAQREGLGVMQLRIEGQERLIESLQRLVEAQRREAALLTRSNALLEKCNGLLRARLGAARGEFDPFPGGE